MSRAKRKRVRPTVKEYNIKGLQIYCICRQADDGSFMIQCDDCKEWFHGNCVGIQEETAPDNYSCILCIQFANSEVAEAPATVSASTTPTLKPPEIKEPEVKRQKIEIEKTDKTEKLRKLAKKGFQETFKLLFQQLKENPKYLDLPLDKSIDLDAPLSFAQDLEEALFAQYSIETQYDCVASDQFNLKDPKNKRLKRRLFCLKESMEKVVQLSPEEMANDDQAIKAEEIARESLHMAYKPGAAVGKGEMEKVKPEDYFKAERVVAITDSISPITATSKSTDTPANTAIPQLEVKPFVPLAPRVKPVVAPKVQRDSLDSLLERMTAPIYKPPVADSKPILEVEKLDSSQTISSVDVLPKKEKVPKEKPIWKGSVKMPQVTEVEVHGYQIAGKQLSLSTWKNLLSSNMLIGGRIPINKTMDYLNQRIRQNTEISILRLESKDSKHYQKLANYLIQKERYGVIADPLPGIKDLYLVPIKRQETHSLFNDLKCRYKINNEKDCLVLVAVMGNGVNKKPVEKKPQENYTSYQTIADPIHTASNGMSSDINQMPNTMPVQMNAFQQPYPQMNNFIPTFPNMNPGFAQPQFANPNFNLNNINPQSFQGLLDGLGLQSQQIGGLLANLLSKQNN
ncbi:hypothetical protein HDV06_004968 [Boothiomyces sp. JEL0866]|nr:hypothetical protein HDV06_004935 [Boothiomyces sp. JEL0866]KAJ3325211.1 hypothetical protein HDV06_004968 [Boothiomyces sp. JEL0866]